MEQTVQTRSCGLLQLGGVAGWEFWWIGEEPRSQQYVVWQIANPMDGLPVTCHGELRMGAAQVLWHGQDSFGRLAG
jgi:hypothetical protein